MRPVVVLAFVLGGVLAAGTFAVSTADRVGANPCAAKNPCAPRK
jgi:hypothetical protein